MKDADAIVFVVDDIRKSFLLERPNLSKNEDEANLDV